MHRAILIGSPRAEGRSAHLADELFNACIEECPDDGVSVLAISSLEVHPCIGCDACKKPTPLEELPDRPEMDDPLAQHTLVYRSDAFAHRCVFTDDMDEVRKHLDAAEELIVVCPLYFASPPAQFKALLDRLQPYFFSDIRDRTNARRSLIVHIVGEGNNPYGIDACVGAIRSACGCAGFKLDRVLDWSGCIEEDGTIVADAVETSYGD